MKIFKTLARFILNIDDDKYYAHAESVFYDPLPSHYLP